MHAAILTLRRASQPDDVIAGLAASTPPCACAAAIVVVASAPQHVRRTGGLTFDRARRHADVAGGRSDRVDEGDVLARGSSNFITSSALSAGKRRCARGSTA